MRTQKKIFKKLITGILFAFLTFFNNVYPSHIVGGFITYKCIGQDSFVVILTLYRDCQGVDLGGTDFVSAYFPSCGQTITINVDTGAYLIPGMGGSQEVSQLCPQYAPFSACNGGNLPGIQRFIYTGLLVIPPGCGGDVELSWSNCCKNAAIVNIANPSSIGTTLITTFNTNVAPCDDGAYVSSMPVPYVCVNQPVSYNYGIVDLNGDSIYVQFTSSLDDAGNPVTYNPGYSATSPIPGISLDPNTGQINFTAPSQTGNYVVTIIIYQYDQNGNLIGTIMQETQFVVISSGGACSPPPQVDSVNMTVNVGGGVLDTSGGYPKVIVCQGTDFCVNVAFSSTNPSDSLFLSTDATQLLSGSSFSQSGYNPATGTFCWQVPPQMPPSNYIINIKAQNNACPIPSMAIKFIEVEVVANTFAGYDTTICLGQSVQLNASGGTQFQWQSISGDPIIVGQNFSCDTCPNPVATPSQSTTYVVTSNLTGGCSNKDTITIYVVPDYSVSISASSPGSCLGQQITLTAQPSPPGNYTYSWSPSQIFTNPSGQSVTTVPLCISGNIVITLNVTASSGCIKKYTYNVSVSNKSIPDVTVSSAGLTTCPADTSLLIFTTNTGGGPCPTSYTLGTQSGQNSSTTYPSPYAHWYRTDHHQFLIRQSELVAAGVPPFPAKIKSISFLVSSIPAGMNTNLPNYTIKIGNTAVNSLSSFITGLTTVYSSNPYTVTTGWNTHVLSTPFQWDGTSNIVIDICSGDLSVIYTYNAICPYTNTSFNSTIYDYSDITDVCSATVFPTVSNKRPIIKIEFEGQQSSFTYSWVGVMPQIISQPDDTTFYILNPDTSTIYKVVITDSSGTCKDTLTIPVNVNKLTVQNDTALCVYGPTQVQLYANGISYCNQGTPVYQWGPAGLLSNPNSSTPTATIQLNTTTTFYVSFSDQCGCILYDSVKVSANPLPYLTASVTPTFSCPPLNSQILIDSSTATNCLWYIYSNENGIQKLIDSITSCNSFSYLLKDHGYYSLVVNISNQYGCKDTIRFDSALYVGINPVADYSYSPAYLTTLETYLSLSNNSLYADSIIWVLNYTDTLNDVTNHIEFPPDTGHYSLTLIAISKDGCVDTITKIIEVKEAYGVWVPNCFTPNKDGINDEFFIAYNGIYVDKKRFEIWIYDRWGELVFYSQDPNFHWDGKHYKLKHLLPQGIYPVKIKTINALNNKPILIETFVAIIY